METLALASFHGNSETLYLQSCGTTDPCICKVTYDTTVNFSLNFVWILIAIRLKWRQSIAIALQRQDATEEVPKLENRW